MKKRAIFQSFLITLFAHSLCYSQIPETTFITKECSLNCGAKFEYNSEIIFTNDSIKIISPFQKVASRYAIIKNRTKWKTVNYHGRIKIMAMDTSDSSNKDFKLVLKHGKGYVNIFGNGDCQMILKIEGEKSLTQNRAIKL